MTHLQISMLLNIGSLVLGVSAVVFAIIAIAVSSARRTHGCSVLSFSFCTISFLLQFFELYNRTIKGDFAAIEDTIQAVVLAAVVLCGVTVFLNIIAKIRAKRKF